MAVSSCGETPNLSMVQVFDERLKRIVEESFEVAFVLCNKEMDEFNASKIFDIFAQVFTTANVLNTAYWPFFTAVNGQCLCVCGRFGIPCRHIKSDNHWIDMQPIAHDIGSAVFYPKRFGPILIQDYEIFIKPIDGNGHYNIGIILSVQYKKSERGRPRRDKTPRDKLTKDDNRKSYPVSIFSRFYTMNQYYAPFFTLMFNPSPFFHESYGTVFKNLIQQRYQQFPSNYREHRQAWCITNSQMPSFTFIPYYVNLPVFKFPLQLHVFNQPHVKCKQHVMTNKIVQTDDGHSLSGIVGNPFTQNMQSLQSLTTLNPQTQEIIIENDYKTDWPSTSNQTNQLMRKYNPNDIIDQSTQKIGTTRNLPTWTPKLEPDSRSISESSINLKQDFSYLGLPSSKSNLNVTNLSQSNQNQQKIKIDDYWSTNFPALKTLPSTLMTKSEIDEEFELIESVIRDDILEDDGNLDWWNNNKQ